MGLQEEILLTFISNIGYQSFPIMSDRPEMSGKTEVGPAKYPTTSDLQSDFFSGQFCFLGLTR